MWEIHVLLQVQQHMLCWNQFWLLYNPLIWMQKAEPSSQETSSVWARFLKVALYMSCSLSCNLKSLFIKHLFWHGPQTQWCNEIKASPPQLESWRIIHLARISLSLSAKDHTCRVLWSLHWSCTPASGRVSESCGQDLLRVYCVLCAANQEHYFYANIKVRKLSSVYIQRRRRGMVHLYC